MRQNDRENETSCNTLSSARKAVLVFLIGPRAPAPLPAAVARRASEEHRRGFCTPDRSGRRRGSPRGRRHWPRQGLRSAADGEPPAAATASGIAKGSAP